MEVPHGDSLPCNWTQNQNQYFLNQWVFVSELSGCGFASSCSHLNFRFYACFEQGVPWNSGNYRVWIHSETRTWHDKNIQSIHYLIWWPSSSASRDTKYIICLVSLQNHMIKGSSNFTSGRFLWYVTRLLFLVGIGIVVVGIHFPVIHRR